MTHAVPLVADPAPAVASAAGLLANAIKARPEWRALADARAAFRTDPGMSAIMARYRAAFGRLSAARARGEHLSGDDALELAEAQQALQAHALFRRQNEATATLVALLREVNRMLSTALELDFAANAAPPSGCCG
ncbi:MAG: YlbF family regulator [Gemmatimonadetes bacterium]|nr:YlbF family regulator [Gemmatimonadota bacterium]